MRLSTNQPPEASVEREVKVSRGDFSEMRYMYYIAKRVHRLLRIYNFLFLNIGVEIPR